MLLILAEIPALGAQNGPRSNQKAEATIDGMGCLESYNLAEGAIGVFPMIVLQCICLISIIG